MAKRFTDTAKWKKEFIKGLEAKHKLLWFYILDDCDHAGVWEVDFEVASLRIGESLNYDEAFIALGQQIIPIGKNKWWIKDFISFQYGNLTPKNKMFAPVMTVLNRYGIDLNSNDKKGDLSPINGVKVKEKVKEEEKVEDKVKETPDEIFVTPETTLDVSRESESLQDFEFWTQSVLDGNDPYFLNMIRSHGVILNGQLERLARDHLGKAARYNWHDKTTTQQAFRLSLLNYIQENLNKHPEKNKIKKEVSLQELKAARNGNV